MPAGSGNHDLRPGGHKAAGQPCGEEVLIGGRVCWVASEKSHQL